MINTYKFPSELVSNLEKASREFGKKYAEAIWSEWESKLAKNKIEFRENRLYAIGKHPIDVCKQNIKGEYIKESFLHIDWEDRINVLPTLLRKVYNGVDMKEFAPVVFALDPNAREQKANKKNEKLELLYSKDLLHGLAEANGGFSDIPLESIPESKEQVELEELTEPPLAIETAEELVLQSVSNENGFNQIQLDAMRDSIECGLGAVHIETCPNEGLKIRKIEPEKFIHSNTTNKFFKDCHYFGEERYLTISQLINIAAESGIEFTDDDIRKMLIATHNDVIDYDKTTIKVLSYSFKTFHYQIYKKKTNRDTKAITLIDRTEDVGTDQEYKPNPKYKSDVSEKVSRTYNVWYEGIMVLSGDKPIIKHNLIENMPKFKGKILPPYVGFAPRITAEGYNSIVSEVKPRVNSAQELRFRIVHQRNRLRGNITEIDPDSLTDVTLGNKKLTAQEVLSFYFTLDLAFRKSMDDEGELINGGRPMTEIPTGIPYALKELMVQYIEDVKMLDESFGYIGFNQSTPDPKTILDGEVYRLSDNIQMRDYSDALYTWSINVFQVISSRIDDIFKYSNLKDKYIDMIGTDDVNVLEKYKDRDLHWFGIFQDYIPTKQERMALINNVNQYVTQGLIDPLDGEEILNIRNKKVALRTLRLKLDKRKKESQDFDMQKSQEMTNGNIQASRISNEEKRITLQMQGQQKQDLKIIEHELRMKELEAEGLIKIQDQESRDAFKKDMAAINTQNSATLASLKKDRDEETRLKSIDKSAYNQQQLIKLRKDEISDIREEAPTQEVDLANI